MDLHLERIAVVLATVRVVNAKIIVVALDLDVVGSESRGRGKGEKEGCEHDGRCVVVRKLRRR